MPALRVRADALVDGVGWPDEGCSLHPSCQTCPLPHCRYEPGYRLGIHRADLRALIAQHRRSQGALIAELQRELDVSRRTVYRLLKRAVPNVVTSRSQQVIVEGGGGGV